MNDKEYPNEIDLGREVRDWDSPAMAASEPDKKEEKTKTVYPCLYVSDIPELLELPKEGCCMIKYRRVGLSENERGGKESVSVELEILKICHADEEEDEAEGHSKIEEGIKALLAEAAGAEDEDDGE